MKITNTQASCYRVAEVDAGHRYLITFTADAPFLFQFGIHETEHSVAKPLTNFIDGIAGTYRYELAMPRTGTLCIKDLRLGATASKKWTTIDFDIRSTN